MTNERKSIIVFVFDADPSIPELIEMLQAKYGTVTATRFEFTPPIVPVDPPPPWWAGLPHRAKIVAVRETDLRDAPGGAPMRRLLAGETAEYWSTERDGWILVFRGPFELWARAMDFQAG